MVTSKALLSRGFSVSLFEKQSKLGGLWVDNYYGAASQVAKDLYEYPEKSYGEKVSRHPTAQEIQVKSGDPGGVGTHSNSITSLTSSYTL